MTEGLGMNSFEPSSAQFPRDDDALVDVYVCEDGGTWSQCQSKRFVIPTDLFDLKMAIGAISSVSDLENVVSLARTELEAGTRSKGEAETIVWAAPDGNWAGSPSLLFKLPVSIFEYLAQEHSRARKLGWLTCEEDVERLITATRLEIEEEKRESSLCIEKNACKSCLKHRVVSEDGNCAKCTTMLEGAREVHYSRTELKECGHVCTISSIREGCCGCLDLREIHEDDGTYQHYTDGKGWTDDATRGMYYCPHCRY
jgi:hypothetical protein